MCKRVERRGLHGVMSMARQGGDEIVWQILTSIHHMRWAVGAKKSLHNLNVLRRVQGNVRRYIGLFYAVVLRTLRAETRGRKGLHALLEQFFRPRNMETCFCEWSTRA